MTPDDRGVILLNVLLIVAVASAVVVVMTAAQDVSLQRTQRLREAAQASSIARAGELSAIVALRRDKIEAPATDHLREPWATVGQTETAIQGGRFSLAITDAQAKFNLNSLIGGGATARGTLAKLLAQASAPPDAIDRIDAYLAAAGPMADIAALTGLGLERDVVDRLGATVTALPETTAVNVNTAGEPLLAAMLANPVSARVLVARRSRTSFLTPEDLTAAKVILPTGMGVTSDHYWVRTEVVVGDTRLVLTSLLERRMIEGKVAVVAVARRRGAGAPLDRAPPL